MNTLLKATAATVLILCGTVASTSAMAQHHGHGGVRFGISVGVPLYGPSYYPSPYYANPYFYPAPVYTYPAPVYAYPAPAYTYPAPVVGSYSRPTYVEQNPAPAAPAPAQAQADWYYCGASKAYYPYVSECATGWQRVPAQPSR